MALLDFLHECRWAGKIPTFIRNQISIKVDLPNHDKKRLYGIFDSMLNREINKVTKDLKLYFLNYNDNITKIPQCARIHFRNIVHQSRLLKEKTLIKKFFALKVMKPKKTIDFVSQDNSIVMNEVCKLDDMKIDTKTENLLKHGQNFAPNQSILTRSEKVQVIVNVDKLVQRLQKRHISEPLPLTTTSTTSVKDLMSQKAIKAFDPRFFPARMPLNVEENMHVSETHKFKIEVLSALGVKDNDQNKIAIECYNNCLQPKNDKAQSSNLAICATDKSGSFVIANKNTIVSKTLTFLANDDAFEQVEIDPIKVANQLAKRFKDLDLDQQLNDFLIRILTPKSHSFGNLKPLMKDHKVDLPVRPVINLVDTPLEAVDFFLSLIVKQIIPFIDTHLGNTNDFIDSLRFTFPNNKFPPGVMAVKLDVESMFTTLPRRELRSVLKKVLTKFQTKICLYNLSVEKILLLFDLWLDAMYFQFGDKWFRQVKGVPMGGHSSTHIASIFMFFYIEKSIFKKTEPDRIKMWRRYVDDIFMAWKGDMQSVIHWQQTIANSIHPSIKFKLENVDNPNNPSLQLLPYLDTQLRLCLDSGAYQLIFYEKPMAQKHFIVATSHHPRNTLFNILSNHLSRMLRYSEKTLWISIIAKFKNKARNSGYHTSLINRVISYTKKKLQEPDRLDKNDEFTIRMSLPFLGERIKRIVSTATHRLATVFNTKIQIAWSSRTLKQIQTTKRFAPKGCTKLNKNECYGCLCGALHGECQDRSVVYILICNVCGALYVGCTDRPFCIRIREHWSNAQHARLDEAFGAHFAQSSHSKFNFSHPPFTARIIFKCRKPYDLYTTEAFFIDQLQPTILKPAKQSKQIRQ